MFTFHSYWKTLFRVPDSIDYHSTPSLYTFRIRAQKKLRIFKFPKSWCYCIILINFYVQPLLVVIMINMLLRPSLWTGNVFVDFTTFDSIHVLLFSWNNSAVLRNLNLTTLFSFQHCWFGLPLVHNHSWLL